MAFLEESYLQKLLNECDTFSERTNREAREAVAKRLDQIYSKLTRNIKETFKTLSIDILIRFAELAVQNLLKFTYAEQIITLFFERVQTCNQFYIRALLVKAKMIAYNGHQNSKKGEEMVVILKESISYVSKALDLIAGPQEVVQKGKDPKGSGGDTGNKSGYGFLIYNASICLYKITRFMLRQNWQRNFVDIYERIVKLFEDLDEPDHDWKCRLTLILFQCLYDADRKPDAFKIIDSLWEKTKNKPCDFQSQLFRLRVHLSKENPALLAAIKKDTQGQDPQGWKILEVIQRIKSGGVPDAQVQKQLMTIVNQISLNVLSMNETASSTTTISPLKQERLAEAGRIALKYNIPSIANSITNYLMKTRQPNQKAMILNQYNKAQLLIKRKGEFVDKKTGMIMSADQIKQLEIESRKEAIKILEKAMIVNKKLDNAQLIYEGAVLVWNICLPFMCPQYRDNMTKVFEISVSLLEQIDCVDHDLRIKMHLQLARIHSGNEQMFFEVESNTLKALKLDNSIPIGKLLFKFDAEEDPSLYCRPYQRYLQDFRDNIMLKTMQVLGHNDLDAVAQDLENAVDQKSETTKIQMLQKCLRTLLNSEDPVFVAPVGQILVDEELKALKIEHERAKLKRYKRKKMLASEIAELSFEWDLNDFAKKACEFVLADTWEGKNALQLIIVQAKCCYFMGQIKIDELNQDNFEVLYEEPVRINDDEKEGEREEGLRQEKDLATAGKLSEETLKELKVRKNEVLHYFKRGLDMASSIQQYSLVFNGAIYIWNNFLHIFRSPSNDVKLKSEVPAILKDFFEAMKNCLKEIQTKGIVYYDLDYKIQIFANIGLIYARLLENQKQNDAVGKICEDLLLTSLSPNTRKLVNGIKARVSSNKTSAKQADPKKGAASIPALKTTGFSDNFIFEVVSQLQAIQNCTNKAEKETMILKCFENLENWKPRENDEIELQLHAQLWVRLSRQALNEDTVSMVKYSLRCADYGLSLLKEKTEISTIPSNRLRWYSLAEFLYSEGLMKIVNPATQEMPSIEKLLFASLDRAVEAAFKGYKCNIGALVLDAAKQIWNICVRLQESRINRQRLMKPIQTILSFLKEMKDSSEVDLILLLSQLFFKAARENGKFKAGEDLADMLFGIVPKNLQKSLWEAKMIFMSKQGKNELQAISNMKEADPSLQAKLWVKLARIATLPAKQQSAYHKAIEILKKEGSVEIVEILIEYAEWQLRVGKQSVQKVSDTLLMASDQLIEIQCDGFDEDEQEAGEDQGTVFSRSTRGKQSQLTHSVKSKQAKTKKAIAAAKGLASSNKSKHSNLSRMNRSGRATKTVKSKNAKSIFTQREEEANPESLNCLHYERLFRIHVILSMISSDANSRIKYALDASKFLRMLLQLSIRTVNELQENSVKFSEKEEKETSFKRIQMPNSLESWANIELPKQFLDRAKKLQNFNFMGTYTFEKPELTFSYVNHLIHIFDMYGLTLQAVPLHFFTKYISKHILGNELLSLLASLKLKYSLFAMKHPLESAVKINLDELVITAQEQKSEKILSENGRNNDEEAQQLVQVYSRSQCWHEIGCILLQLGQISMAKVYLQAALPNFTILMSSELIGQTHLRLAEISYYNGQDASAIEHLVQANKQCKSSRNWQQIVLVSARVLVWVDKLQNLTKFIGKIQEVVRELVKENLTENKQKAVYQAESLELNNILCTIQIVNLYVAFLESVDKDANEAAVGNFELAISKLLTRFGATQPEKQGLPQHYILTATNLKLILEYLQVIFRFYETGGHCSLQTFPLDKSNIFFQQLFLLLDKVEKAMIQTMKYATIERGQEYGANLVCRLLRAARFLMVKGYIILEKLQTGAAADKYSEKDFAVSGGSQLSLAKYIELLSEEVDRKNNPAPVSMPPLDTAAALLESIRITVTLESPDYPRWLAEYAYVQSLRARQELQDLWLSKQQKNEGGERPLAQQSLEAAQAFQTEGEGRILSLETDINSFYFSRKGYLAMMQNRGSVMAMDYFQYLCKYQHSSYSLTVIKILSSKLDKNHRFLAALRLLSSIDLDKPTAQALLQNSKLLPALMKFPNYKECLSLMPKNSAYIVLQFNPDKSEFYFGCLANGKEQQEKKCIVKKNRISKKALKAYITIRDRVRRCKSNMIKLPFEDPKKQQEMIDNNELLLRDSMKMLAKLSKWWLDDVISLLNKPREAPVITDSAKDKKTGKNPNPNPKKKGGKEQISAYQCSLPSTPSGIDNVTLLLDDFLYVLPFEHLPGLEIVPAISRDTTLFYVSRKLEEMGYQPDLNNSAGFGADKGKYFSYDFKNPAVNFKHLAIDITKQNSSLKFEGNDSMTRYPSLIDYNKAFTEPGFMQVYGIIDFLNHVKFNTLMQSVGYSRLKLLIVHDQLNWKKSILNKFIDLNCESETTELEEQDLVLTTAMNLMNISLVKNRWTSTAEVVVSNIATIYKNLGSGSYLGSIHQQEGSTIIQSHFNKQLCYINGPPVLRM